MDSYSFNYARRRDPSVQDPTARYHLVNGYFVSDKKLEIGAKVIVIGCHTTSMLWEHGFPIGTEGVIHHKYGHFREPAYMVVNSMGHDWTVLGRDLRRI